MRSREVPSAQRSHGSVCSHSGPPAGRAGRPEAWCGSPSPWEGPASLLSCSFRAAPSSAAGKGSSSFTETIDISRASAVTALLPYGKTAGEVTHRTGSLGCMAPLGIQFSPLQSCPWPAGGSVALRSCLSLCSWKLSVRVITIIVLCFHLWGLHYGLPPSITKTHTP